MSGFGVHVPELQLTGAQIAAALDLAALQPGERYLELGSGEGFGLIAAAQRGARAVGIEILPDAVERSRRRATNAGTDVTIETGDLLKHDMSSADVILMHLGPAFHDVLAPKFERDLTARTRVVACGWRVPGWHATGTTDHGGAPAYMYNPADPATHVIWESATDMSVVEVPATDSRAGVVGVVLTAGVELWDVSVTAAGSDGHPRCDATTLQRGEPAMVEVVVPAAGSVELTVTARSHAVSEPVQRGPTLTIAAPDSGDADD